MSPRVGIVSALLWCENVTFCIVQKEVPSFFVNSHLDLECQVLKSFASPGRPPPSPASRPNSGCNSPSLNRRHGETIRFVSGNNFAILEFSVWLPTTFTTVNGVTNRCHSVSSLQEGNVLATLPIVYGFLSCSCCAFGITWS